MRGCRLLGVVAAALLTLGSAPADKPGLAGFSDVSARVEREWEAKFRAIPDPANLRAYVKRLSARPHAVGSAYDKDNAEWILSQFKAWGLEAKIETFDVLFPTPKERRLEMIAPTRFVAALQEPAVAVDPTSGQTKEQLPTYNAYSADGDVTGPLVYVNYGVPDDYDRLQRLGVSVKGAVVIARYGHSWRGIKPKVAAEHGAVGCLIYSDPRDDGYFEGATFPAGPFRPDEGVQRGSVMDTYYVGDPLTPGVGATKDAKRLALKDVTVITKIPVLPISYGDAKPLLAALGGPTAPEAWRGALPITYHVGPGAAEVHLVVKSNWDIKPVYDVIATIPGSTFPDEWVIRGNHHDAWVNGAEDPVSGQAALLEEARAYGELLKQGWRPKRTIVYCAWDGEEPGLLGSTEWAETHAAELSQHAVAYLNSDSNGRGYLSMGGSHTLEAFYNDVARDITDPESGVSVWKRLRLHRIEDAKTAEERKEIRKRPDLRIGALGFGSDYTVFLDHLGIPCISLGFGGEDEGGIYHSVYDDFYSYTHFGDTTFVYGRALAQTTGTAVIRLADADLLPYRFTNLADTVDLYLGQLKKLLQKERAEARERNLELEEGVFAATVDPRAPLLPPPAEAVPPHLNFAPLENAAEALAHSAERYDKAVAKARANGGAGLADESVQTVNATLMGVERAMLDPAGLPDRPWFENLLYAPGMYTGYGVKTVPMVREAIELRRWQEADEGIVRTAKVLADVAAVIDRATAALEKTGM
ncbi:MAG TPA: transferrin receptor-like dimerization domain-containing protein [Thermoanaerobaculaceae bacterium]|nr:transferrin receptor-like dimerization domain-containing protein [Thermoanaerobaculaceae bacterium]